MKNLYFLLLLFISSVSYSQELYLGKYTDELNNTRNKTYNTTFNGKQAICEVIDTNITDIYLLNSQGFCIEYDRLYSNTELEIIEKYLSDIQGSVWINNTKGLITMISQMSSTLYKVSIRKTY